LFFFIGNYCVLDGICCFVPVKLVCLGWPMFSSGGNDCVLDCICCLSLEMIVFEIASVAFHWK